MYPLSEDVLSLGDVATHWARDIPQQPPWQELTALLVESMWRSELNVIDPDGHPDPRRRLLELLTVLPNLKRIRIFSDAASIRESIKGLPKRVAAFDTRTSIILPADRACWDASIVEAAYAVLADALLDDHSLEFLVLLMRQTVSRPEFERYCLARGYELPSFWFGTRRRKVSTAKAQQDCKAWLNGLVSAGPKPNSKMALWLQAKAKFPLLSRRAFDETWARITPASWRKAGARPGLRSLKTRRSVLRAKSNHLTM
jgi:hypothetical protein